MKKVAKLGYAALFLLASALFGTLAFFAVLSTPFFDTPKDRVQAREIDHLKLNYALLERKMDEVDEALSGLQQRDDEIYRSYFNAAPVSADQRRAATANNDYKQLEGYNNSQLVTLASQRMDRIVNEVSVQSKSLDEIVALARKKQKLLEAIPAIQPVRNENLRTVASGFGYRTDPFTKVSKFHSGMDFSAKTGTPVFATGDGIVERADNTESGYGNHIVIRHGYGYETLYGHLSKYKAKRGQRVKRGEIIGYVGSTGRSEAPHLHYEVHRNGEVVNPLNFYYGNISAAEYVAIAKAAAQENQSLD